jgi:hypothetical protein
MAKQLRGGTHTTLTETSSLIVSVLERIPGVNMISPGIITKSRSRSGKRYVTAVFTNAGMELIISGQSIQKVAVHCAPPLAPHIFEALSTHKRIAGIECKTRERRPGI